MYASGTRSVSFSVTSTDCEKVRLPTLRLLFAEPLFDAVDTVRACLGAWCGLVPGLKVRREAMQAAAGRGFTTATDLADYLVARGVPFRDAHAVVGGIVRHALEQGRALPDLSLQELQKFSDAIGEDAPFDLRFGEAAEAVRALQARYDEQGYGPGHRIGLALDNHPAFFLHFLALNALGAGIVPLNSAMRAEELAPIVAAADLDGIVAWPRHRPALDATLIIAGVGLAIAEASLADLPNARRGVAQHRREHGGWG